MQDVWPNGKALDYESRDSRFDPVHVHFFPNFSGIRHDATSLSCNRRLSTTADKHLAVQRSSNRAEYVNLD